MNASTLKAGSRLGPYEIAAPIGAGGMGEVYRALDTRLDRTVAIKVLPGHLAADPEGRRRFEREARAVSSLSHRTSACSLTSVGASGPKRGVDWVDSRRDANYFRLRSRAHHSSIRRKAAAFWAAVCPGS